MPKLPKINVAVGRASRNVASVRRGTAGSQAASPSPTVETNPRTDRDVAPVRAVSRERPSLLATQYLFVPGLGNGVGVDGGEILDHDHVLVGFLGKPVRRCFRGKLLLTKDVADGARAKLGEGDHRLIAEDVVHEELAGIFFGDAVAVDHHSRGCVDGDTG